MFKVRGKNKKNIQVKTFDRTYIRTYGRRKLVGVTLKGVHTKEEVKIPGVDKITPEVCPSAFVQRVRQEEATVGVFELEFVPRVTLSAGATPKAPKVLKIYRVVGNSRKPVRDYRWTGRTLVLQPSYHDSIPMLTHEQRVAAEQALLRGASTIL